MALMIAPAAAPSTVTGPAAGAGADSADGGEQFAQVLDQAGTSSGPSSTGKRDGSGAGDSSGRDSGDSADQTDAQSAAMLALAGTVIALNPMRPVGTALPSANAESAVATEVSAVGLANGPVAGSGLVPANSPVPPDSEPAQPAGGAATGPVNAEAGQAAEAGRVTAVRTAAGGSGTPPTISSATVQASTALPGKPKASIGQGTAEPASPAETSTAPAPTATSVAQASTASPSPTAKSGAPESLGKLDPPVTGHAVAHPGSTANTKSDSDKQDGHSGQPGSAPSEAARTGSPSQPAGPAATNPLLPTPQPVGSQPATNQAAQAPVQHYQGAPGPLAHQLSGPVLDVRASGDGSHQLSISLHPADLGPVNLHVRIVGDVMTIQLASTSESAHDAIRAALPQLRHELQSAGLNRVDVSLDFTAGGQAHGNQADGNPAYRNQAPGDRADRHSADRVPAHHPIAIRPSATASSGLDRWL